VIAPLLLLQAAPATPLPLAPFYDHPAAAKALDGYLSCVGHALFARAANTGPVTIVADEVRVECRPAIDQVRAELTKVFAVEPGLRGSQQDPKAAADEYTSAMTGRLEATIEAGRAAQKDKNAQH